MTTRLHMTGLDFFRNTFISCIVIRLSFNDIEKRQNIFGRQEITSCLFLFVAH